MRIEPSIKKRDSFNDYKNRVGIKHKLVMSFLKKGKKQSLKKRNKRIGSMVEGFNPSNIIKNLKSLEKLLNQSKQGNGSYTEMITKHENCDEFIELINKSILPDEKNGLVNKGTSMFPNIYSIEDTPIWINGSMGSVWFDCKTSDGNFWRISLEERKFFHVEDLQYHFIRNQKSMFSQLSGEPIPTRLEIYQSIELTKRMCELYTEFELNGNNEVKIHRDLVNEGWDKVNSTIRKVKDGFEYHDKEWGTNVPPRLYKDIDRLIWEFDLPKYIKDSVMKLIQVPSTKGVNHII